MGHYECKNCGATYSECDCASLRAPTPPPPMVHPKVPVSTLDLADAALDWAMAVAFLGLQESDIFVSSPNHYKGANGADARAVVRVRSRHNAPHTWVYDDAYIFAPSKSSSIVGEVLQKVKASVHYSESVGVGFYTVRSHERPEVVHSHTSLSTAVSRVFVELTLGVLVHVPSPLFKNTVKPELSEPGS